MSNSKLADVIFISPNSTNPRNHAIDTVTIHHMGADMTVEQCGTGFARLSRKASANYGIGSDGRIGLYVEEKNRSWASGSRENDHRAVTVEVANCETQAPWRVSDKAYESLIALCADICRRNGIRALNYTGDTSGNLTLHKMFQATECPGAYLESKMPEIAARVNEILNGKEPEKKEGYCTVEVKVLKKGAKGEEVKAMQILLKGRGYSVGVLGVDGSFGGKTETALRAYQKDHKLAVDGSCGPATWKSLLGV